jgi:hypothetical protein
MGKNITELKEKRDMLINELDDLHIFEDLEHYVELKKNDLEYQIAILELRIVDLELKFYFKKHKIKRIIAIVLLIVIVYSFIYMIF